MLSLINVSPEGHNLEYMLQMELKAMDQIIEEATNKIIEIYSDSKSSNNGIKLEVHDKILDSCTSLMKSIKILIKKSRLLQEEIVAQGKGTYKRYDSKCFIYQNIIFFFFFFKPV